MLVVIILSPLVCVCFAVQKTQKYEKSAISARPHHEKPHTHTHTHTQRVEYLGRMLSADDTDDIAIYSQLEKAKKVWGMMVLM
jgi:hypothetical protein